MQEQQAQLGADAERRAVRYVWSAQGEAMTDTARAEGLAQGAQEMETVRADLARVTAELTEARAGIAAIAHFDAGYAEKLRADLATAREENASLEEMLWQLYEGLYGHRECHSGAPFSTAVEGALSVKKAFRDLYDKQFPALRKERDDLRAQLAAVEAAYVTLVDQQTPREQAREQQRIDCEALRHELAALRTERGR